MNNGTGGIHAVAKNNVYEVMMKVIRILLRIFKKIYSCSIFRSSKYYDINLSVYYTVLNNIGILNYRNSNESGEYTFLKKYFSLINTPIVFDIGANKGNYIKMVSEINKGAKIFAFEPDKTAYNKLGSIKSDNISLYNYGLSDKVGEMEFYNRKDELGSGHSSLYKEVITDIHKVGFISMVYKFSTIDNFVMENNIQKIDLLKIDTEGHELAVLIGAKETIEAGKVSIIHFEFNEMNVISRSFFRDFILILSEYNFYRMLPDSIVKLEPYVPVRMEIFAFQNIVAIRKGTNL